MATAIQRERYREAVEALASSVFESIFRPDAKDALERALSAVRALERSGDSEHAWIFRDPSVFALSDHVFEALDARPDGRREWLHGDLASAVAAVARFDVMAEVVMQMGIAGEEQEEGEPIGPGEA